MEKITFTAEQLKVIELLLRYQRIQCKADAGIIRYELSSTGEKENVQVFDNEIDTGSGDYFGVNGDAIMNSTFDIKFAVAIAIESLHGHDDDTCIDKSDEKYDKLMSAILSDDVCSKLVIL